MNLLPAFTQSRHSTLAPFINQVFCCDALDLLRSLPDASIDMVLCDLPYQITQNSWDEIIPLDIMWAELNRIVKDKTAIVLTANQPFTSMLVSTNVKKYSHCWYWMKNRPTNGQNAKKQPLRQIEDILVFGSSIAYYPQGIKRVDKIVRNSKSTGGTSTGDFAYGDVYTQEFENYPRNLISFALDSDSIHPTQKPVALFEYLIKTYTQAGETVLDMTCGSGTTAVACIKTDRKYICGDNGVDDRTGEQWASIARQRIQNTDPMQATILPDGTKQLSLFSA